VIPVVFRTPRSLARINVIALGLAISAMTSASFMTLWEEERVCWPIVVGVPTFVVGAAWGALLRRRERVGWLNLGWILSVPLAALNAGVACGLMLCADRMEPTLAAFLGGVVLGATFGAIIWVPALALVLLLFGLPIARARELAAKGLAGEDRGERVVGVTCAVFGVAAIAVARFATHVTAESYVLLVALAALAVAFGIGATIVATKRERARARFVERVAADEVPGLKVVERDAGRVLVRVEPNVETYRVAPKPDEELFELDDEGRVVRSVS